MKYFDNLGCFVESEEGYKINNKVYNKPNELNKLDEKLNKYK